MCELYIDLATQHVRGDVIESAKTCLAEAIATVTGHQDASTVDGPENLWRLCFRLAQLFAATDEPQRAIEWGELALQHAVRIAAKVVTARVAAMLAAQYDRVGEEAKAQVLRDDALEKLRQLGDRRGAAELLLASAQPTAIFHRINAASLREAEALASEIGWSEGVSRARRKSSPPPVHG